MSVVFMRTGAREQGRSGRLGGCFLLRWQYRRNKGGRKPEPTEAGNPYFDILDEEEDDDHF